MTGFDETVPDDDVTPDGDETAVSSDDASDETEREDPIQGADRERGFRTGGDEDEHRSHQLSQGSLGATADYGDG